MVLFIILFMLTKIMDIFNKEIDTKISWADMCDSDEENHLGIETPKLVEKENVTEEYTKRLQSKDNTYKNILVSKKENIHNEKNTLGLKTPKIVKNITNEFMKKEKEYHKSNKNIKNEKSFNKIVKIKKNIKKKGKCYTCFPQRKVLKHIIVPVISDKVSFHHDMWNRNIIIVTPKKHYICMDDFPDKELVSFFRNISEFCKNWNLSEYSVSYNNGDWKNHEHFHCKIKILEKVANRMRADFFRMQKLKKEYK